MDVTTDFYNLNESYYTTSGNEYANEDWSTWVKVIYSILFIVIGTTNIVGNTCTLIAYFSDANLQTLNNYYICNLAITDLLIGISSVPFYAVYTLLYYEWPFGVVWCKAWCVIDFLACAESGITIILISLDRLLMVKLGPAQYPQVVTKKRTIGAILVSWVVAFFLYGPAIIGYDVWRGYSIIVEGDCDVEFAEEFIYTLITSLIEFCVPFILVTAFNVYLYWYIHKKSRPQVLSGASRPARQTSRERRAARKLTILVVAFFVCWTPYTVCTIIIALCPHGCVNFDLYEFFNWLLWVNSSLNPILYAFAIPRIRDYYRRLLGIRKKQQTCESQ